MTKPGELGDQIVNTPEQELDHPMFDELWKGSEAVPPNEGEPESPAPEEARPEEGEPEAGEPKGEPKVEPSEEPEGESVEEPKTEFNLDSIEDETLREQVRSELEKSKQIAEETQGQLKEATERKTQLESKIGEQGRELGTLRGVFKEERESLDSKLAVIDDNYVKVISNYESQIENAKDNGNHADKVRLEDDLDTFRQHTRAQKWQEVKQFTDKVEDAFLQTKGNEVYAGIRGKFDPFIQKLQLPMVNIKSDPNMLAIYYDLLLRSERGTPENLEKITKEAKQAKLDSAAKVKNVAQPDAGARKTQKPDKKDDSGVTWDPDVATGGGIL